MIYMGWQYIGKTSIWSLEYVSFYGNRIKPHLRVSLKIFMSSWFIKLQL